MAFCAKCGAQMNQGAAFCPACGNAIATTASGAAAAPAPAAATTGMTNNVAGMLCYLAGWITGLIFLLIEPYKNDKVVRFHAFQSIFFNVGMIAVYIAYGILSGILGVISKGFAGLITIPLFFLMWLGFIGDLAAKQAGL